MLKPFVRLLNDSRFQMVTLMTFAFVLNREGDRVPSGNEFIYLLYFFKGWHPTFLATDWTFQEPTAGHAIFNYATGWLTRLMSIETAAWVGRVLCWFGVFAGLLRLGRHFKIPLWSVWLGILLWLMEGQSLVTQEWMVGTFEAKCIAYICLLFSIDAVLDGKLKRAGILCGLTFSFHSAIGMWAGMALGLAVLTNYSIRQTLMFSTAVIIFSLPGLITSLPLITGPHPITLAEAEFLTTKALPTDFDSLTFPLHWMIALALIPLFTAFFTALRWSDRQIRMLAIFELGTAAFFWLGALARALNQFKIVELFPMRVFAVFAMLFFFWQLAKAICDCRSEKSTIILAVLLFFVLPNPIWRLWEKVATHFPGRNQTTGDNQTAFRNDDADFQKAATWISENAAPTDIVIAPPWHNDGFYYIRRPLIANWHAPRYDDITGWQTRLESLVGDVSHLRQHDPDNTEMDSNARLHFENLSIIELADIKKRFGGHWLLTRGHYLYPQLFTAGQYSVYRLP